MCSRWGKAEWCQVGLDPDRVVVIGACEDECGLEARGEGRTAAACEVEAAETGDRLRHWQGNLGNAYFRK
jgi:hypothetical protein